ncbi:hypothetical protein CHS0354_023976 [Potamilus streckersoni]|uniref:Peptidase M20 dimerisation domain-containing protein n=1 Tax=Potamilus streckersoni TaxID=2493646 RepID=A0AAE0S008_9BIVA|nr:hypothetical protein CHS0354_023976 [Potamilus streckersoni]
MVDLIKKQTNHIFNEIVDLRRDFHRNPELSFEEKKTSQKVKNYLHEIGVDAEKSIAGTGVVAKIIGTKKQTEETNGKVKRIALRADMDALPLTEETNHTFKSNTPNVMHACGHDAHTAMLLGVGKILSQNRNIFSGEVVLMFQPGEELLPGGALQMLKEGIFDPLPDAVFGQHCIPQIDVGKIGFYEGPMMAATDELYITVKGEGGHGSAPHRTKDPVLASVQIVQNIQSIISRNFPPEAPGVISITSIHGGHATNIIPNEVKLMGTLRTMNQSIREMAYVRLHDIVFHTGKALGVNAQIEIRHGYPVLINSTDKTQFAKAAAIEFLGESNVITPEPIMGAEDFAYFLQKAPGSFWQLGVRNEAQGIVHNIHSSQFDLDEEAIRVGNQTEIKIELREIRTALEKIDDRLDKVEVRLEKVETNTNTLTFDLKAHRNSSEAHRRTTNIPEK